MTMHTVGLLYAIIARANALIPAILKAHPNSLLWQRSVQQLLTESYIMCFAYVFSHSKKMRSAAGGFSDGLAVASLHDSPSCGRIPSRERMGKGGVCACIRYAKEGQHAIPRRPPSGADGRLATFCVASPTFRLPGLSDASTGLSAVSL